MTPGPLLSPGTIQAITEALSPAEAERARLRAAVEKMKKDETEGTLETLSGIGKTLVLSYNQALDDTLKLLSEEESQ